MFSNTADKTNFTEYSIDTCNQQLTRNNCKLKILNKGIIEQSSYLMGGSCDVFGSHERQVRQRTHLQSLLEINIPKLSSLSRVTVHCSGWIHLK